MEKVLLGVEPMNHYQEWANEQLKGEGKGIGGGEEYELFSGHVVAFLPPRAALFMVIGRIPPTKNEGMPCRARSVRGLYLSNQKKDN